MTLDEALQLHRDGQLDAASAAYGDYVAEFPDDADGHYFFGLLRQQRGELAEAAALLRRATSMAPDVAQFHLVLGGVLIGLSDEAGARAAFEQTLQLDPNLTQAHSLLGYLQLLEGDVEAAENRFKIGRRSTDPFAEDDVHILLGLGNIYLERDDGINAAKFLGRAAERAPDDAAVQTSLGRAFFMQGAFAFAEKAFENALRLRPDLTLAKLYLARSRFRQDKLEAARTLFAELLERKQQPFGANAGLGDIARKKGQTVKALKFYRHALAIGPAHPGAINACAFCMEKLGDLAGAVHYLADGLKIAPQAHELRRPLAELLDRLGRPDEAAAVRAAAQATS